MPGGVSATACRVYMVILPVLPEIDLVFMGMLRGVPTTLVCMVLQVGVQGIMECMVVLLMHWLMRGISMDAAILVMI
jgi:hypothetical protein